MRLPRTSFYTPFLYANVHPCRRSVARGCDRRKHASAPFLERIRRFARAISISPRRTSATATVSI